VTPTPTGGDDEDTEEESDSPFSDILKDKPKIQYGAGEWIKEARRAFRAGDYKGAIDCYNAAEAIIASGYKDKESRPSNVDEALADVEESKVAVYANWPGHEAERQEARQNVRDLKQSAETKKKLESWDLPGFEVYAALLSAMLVFLFRRIKY
jgi:septation ring formation regulator EzrA